MNISHAGVTQWGLTHVDIKPHFTILEVGCGGGQTIKTLSSRVPDGKVYGIDYSEESAITEIPGNAFLEIMCK
jgi:cyclopropane fatty-acyl-phospholipid synthase-like methyltransferase